MEYRKAFLTLLMVCLGFTLFAQTKGKVFVVEALVCDSTGAAIRDVAVYDGNNDLRSITDRDGIARIATRMGETLYLSHLVYKTKSIEIEDKSLMDSEDGRKAMVVVMQRKTNTLQEVTVTENAPHLAYANKTVWVIDYKVQHDGIYMVAGNGTDYCLLHLGFEQDTISRKPIAPKFQELYRDAFDNLHLIGPDSTYQIYCDGRQLHLLYGCKKDILKQKLKPVVAATDSIIILEMRRNYGQEAVFIGVNRNNGQRFLLQDIGGQTLEMAQNWALDNYREALIDAVGSEDTVYMRNFGVHEEASGEVNNLKDSVKKRVMLRSVYCPLFGIGNELYLFAFPEDRIVVFDKNGQREREMEIDFHKNLGIGLNKHLTSTNPWDNNLIFDPVRKMMYAQFASNGIVTLKEVDLNDGKVKREIRLSDHSFPQNIQVYNGKVYYLFLNTTQTASRDRRSLYKMRLK
ncbi:MAG: hypothetical protein K6G25_04060 [Bacteroidales bacterium]|nr:hypothetical protein [Bacteroidales bacterium]